MIRRKRSRMKRPRVMSSALKKIYRDYKERAEYMNKTYPEFFKSLDKIASRTNQEPLLEIIKNMRKKHDRNKV